MSEWIEYKASDNQKTDLINSGNGYLLKINNKMSSRHFMHDDFESFNQSAITHYFICTPPHPLADMICQWASTGQTVYVKYFAKNKNRTIVYETCAPDWNTPNAHFSFVPFEDKSCEE